VVLSPEGAFLKFLLFFFHFKGSGASILIGWFFFLTTKDTKVITKVTKMHIEIIFKTILDCCFRIHSSLGPGLLESAYEECLNYELSKSGLSVRKQAPLPLIYKEIKLDIGYRVDLLVENKVIIEIKSVEALADIHTAQLLTYLKLSGCKLGLLANFNVTHLKDGIKRLIL
jgi:GxxExxY protein